MELESYFNFINENAIWIKGTRVGIEYMVEAYNEGLTPEEIRLHYTTVELEQIYATITYYLANREKIDEYVRQVRAEQEEAWQEQQRNPSEFVLSMRKRLEEYRKCLHEQNQAVSVAEPE